LESNVDLKTTSCCEKAGTITTKSLSSPDKAQRNRKDMEADMKKTISIALLCGAAALTGPASSQPSQTTAQYALPLTLALEAATEAVRVCVQHGYLVSATVVNMDGVPRVALRGDGASIHTRESSFEKAFTVVTLGPIFDFDTSGKFSIW
jgi:hypothetical protein